MSSCKKCGKEVPEGASFCPWCGKAQQPQKRKHRKRPDGMGSVYKLAGNRARPWAAKSRGVFIGTFATSAEASEALARLVDRPVSEKYNWTFAEVFGAWKVEHYKEIGAAGVSQYDRAYDVFGSLHDRRFRDLRAQDFQDVLDEHAGAAKSTVEKYKQLVTQMGTWAQKNEIVTTNFASFAKAEGRKGVPRQPMTDDEVARIQEAAAGGDEAAMIVAMLLATGLRISELFELPLAGYHGDYLIGGEKSEAGRDRVVPIRPEGRVHFEHFAALASVKLLDGYSGNKDAHNFRGRDYKALLDRLGIDRAKTPHSTRTTYVTRAVAEGLAPAVLQKVVGHADFSTTQEFYNRPDAKTLVGAVEAAAGADLLLATDAKQGKTPTNKKAEKL